MYTLLLNGRNIGVENAKVFLSSVNINFLMKEILEIIEVLEISLFGNFADIE
ncbi:hypothetical protein [Nostoc sp.]|uniref:hypothetical protein n=1 Tax=Nostoc sp. TaxID=1180 RepID=UPI002FFC739E